MASLDHRHDAGRRPADWLGWLRAQGELGAAIASYDWTRTSLGPITGWPAEMRSAVSICVGSSIPMALWWGPDLVVIPNLATREVFGAQRFAAALGRPVAEVWPEALPRIRGEMERLLRTGEPFFAVDSLTCFDRAVADEEVYLTYSYTPITDARGCLAGVLCVFVETTGQVLGRRRNRLLAELGHALAGSRTEPDVLAALVGALAANPEDHPAGAVVDAAEPATAIAVFGGRPDEFEAAALVRACAGEGPVHGGIVDPDHGTIPPSSPGGWHAYLLAGAGPGRSPLVLVLAHNRQRPFDTELERYFELIASLLRTTLATLRERARVEAAGDRARSADAAWRAAVLRSMHDPIVIFDSEGEILELNEAFTALFGYSMADGPIRPPYPWWPTEEEDATGRAGIWDLHRSLMREPRQERSERCFYTRDRRPVWVEILDSFIENGGGGTTAHIRIVRDITRNRDAQERRAAAARVSADFATIEDLATLLSVAEHAYGLLFDGTTTIQLDLGRRYLFSGGRTIEPGELSVDVRAGLGSAGTGAPSGARAGILLTPCTATARARAWIQFREPRRLGADEIIVADLLAQAFALAIDRLQIATEAAGREHHLELAVESHRLIGQAVGILVERHRILPVEAFERLKVVSQQHNVRLRDIAVRVIETGVEPEQAVSP